MPSPRSERALLLLPVQAAVMAVLDFQQRDVRDTVVVVENVEINRRRPPLNIS